MKDSSTGLIVESSTPVRKQCLKKISALFDLGAKSHNPIHPSLNNRSEGIQNYTAKCFKG